jgi:predicted metal-dependent phosphotriesterase family hydrolase
MRSVVITVICTLLCWSCTGQSQVMTVKGFVDADKLGFTLPHEHVLVDFIGANSVSPSRYNRDSAFQTILPRLVALKSMGGATLIECTPAYLGRDPALLKRLSDASGLNIITNTGYYGAVNEKYYPGHAFTETAEQIAARWIAEWKDGIDGTGVRPGFMKLGADRGALTETQKKMVRAAAITHLATGLTIGIHNGGGQPAQEALHLLVSSGVVGDAFIWIHAQNEREPTLHRELARLGAWIEYDGLNENNIHQYVEYLTFAKAQGFLNKVLISHDAGWYHVGEVKGGEYRDYNTLNNSLLPALRQAGFTQDEIDLVTTKNPADAFAVRVRKRQN